MKKISFWEYSAILAVYLIITGALYTLSGFEMSILFMLAVIAASLVARFK